MSVISLPSRGLRSITGRQLGARWLRPVSSPSFLSSKLLVMVVRSLFRAPEGCCICGTKSSSSRFTHSDRYSRHFSACFGPQALTRCGPLCNACVLQIKRCMRKFQSSGPIDTTKGHWEATHVLDCRRCPGTRNVGKNTGLCRGQSVDEEGEEIPLSYRLKRQREREEFKNSSSTDENSRSPLKPYGIYGGQRTSHALAHFQLALPFLPSSMTPTSSSSSSSPSSASSISQGFSPFKSKQDHFIEIDDLQSLQAWEEPVRRSRKILSPVRSPSEGEIIQFMHDLRQRDHKEYFVDMRVVHMLLQQQMRRAKKLSIGRELEK